MPQFQRWSISLLSITVNRERGDRRLRRRCGTTSRRSSRPGAQEPRDDLISEPRAGRDRRGAPLGRGDLLASCACCSRPASRPRTARPGNLLFGLLSQPRAARRRCARDRSLIPQAIEEAVRWEAAAADDHARGHARHGARRRRRSRPARRSCACIGAANRDEASLPGSRPLRHLPRAEAAHLVRATASTSCLGMHLARLEMRVALERAARPPARPAPRSRGRRSAHPRAGVPVTDVAAGPVRGAAGLSGVPSVATEVRCSCSSA